LYHLGIARIALLTSDLAADVQVLKSQGVEFISEPVLLETPQAPATRFVCFKDPDGTVLEFVEMQQPTAR
jgi:catechol 2,3-dioxygenase-like lactoylglutathione lyase family enzyme